MTKILYNTDKILSRISKTMSHIATVLVMCMMVVLSSDVVLRAILNKPIKGSHEIVSFLMLIVVSFGLAYTQFQKSNIAVGIFVDKLSGARMLVFRD